MMIETIPYLEVAPIGVATIQFVSNFSVTAKEDGKTPSLIVLNIAVDSEKTLSKQCEMPIFVSATIENIFHAKLMRDDLLENSFVAVRIDGLVIKRKYENGRYKYFGFADRFVYVKNPTDYIDEETYL